MRTPITPERRTRVDLVVSAVIVVVLVVAGVAVWYVSPARHADDVQATSDSPAFAPADVVPAAFVARWHAASAATGTPAITKSLIVTADGGEVTGRDPETGHQVWRYSRDIPLCTAAAAWPNSADEVLAVYRNSRGCSEVTALDGGTGRRVGNRTSDADDTLHLVTDSGYVLAQGPGRLETWGSNLVRGIEYGRVIAPVNPDVQPGRTDCTLFSSAISGDRLTVIERCADDPGYRLTVLGALLDSNEKVTQYGSSLITDIATGPPPVVIAMSGSAIAVYDGGTNASAPSRPTIRLFDTDGAPAGTDIVQGNPAPPADSIPLTSGGVITYFTGTATVVLDAQSLRPRYLVPSTLGPGEMMAGELLLPGPSGVSVRDPATGRPVRTIALKREGYTGGTVSLRVAGESVVEQRGPTVEVYGPAG
ncbi:Rv3212 family protein [Gordonia desulfuricans]|uniref:Rv3212 family protein n=1 Tax=Gordonia desulfuricans TaxID=89051 RepID=UPI000AA50999|nr:hypothetical protein [Gordonia desulfuricans]